jgi:hypothetical protein
MIGGDEKACKKLRSPCAAALCIRYSPAGDRAVARVGHAVPGVGGQRGGEPASGRGLSARPDGPTLAPGLPPRRSSLSIPGPELV